MRDGGKTWQEIRRMWKEETGEESGKSTLPNRYMCVFPFPPPPGPFPPFPLISCGV